MSDSSTYKEYTADGEGMALYYETQAKFLEEPRESDKILIDHVTAAVKEVDGPRENIRLLDAGCSSSSLLYHIGKAVPDVQLCGVDIAVSVIDQNRQNPHFSGINYEEMDITRLSFDQPFDIIVCNRSLCFFTPDELGTALKSLAGALRPGGALIVLDWMSPFGQEVMIRETSVWYPEGLTFFYRSYDAVAKAMAEAGLAPPEFTPFDIPVDLPKHEDNTQIYTYTVKDVTGTRHQFRGALSQPWTFALTHRK